MDHRSARGLAVGVVTVLFCVCDPAVSSPDDKPGLQPAPGKGASPNVAAHLAGEVLGDIRPTDAGRGGGPDGSEKKEPKLVPDLDRGDSDDGLDEVVKEGEQNLREIQKLLDEIQKELADQQTGAPTQEKQREVVEKMDRLLEGLQKQCKKSSSGSSSQKQQSTSQKQQKADEKEQEKQGQKQREQQQKAQAQQQQSEQEKKGGKTENDRVDEDKMAEAGAATLRDQLLELSRRWGLLPPKLREEALFSTGKEAPREYLEIISRYYRKMSEYYEGSSSGR